MSVEVNLPTVTLSRSNTLANFSVTKLKNEDGMDITPEERYTNELIRCVRGLIIVIQNNNRIHF